jgi:hypothetical protein
LHGNLERAAYLQLQRRDETLQGSDDFEHPA